MKNKNELALRTRAALYIRVSTEEQVLHGLSIDAQTEALDAWAQANHIEVVGHYIDAGISARKPAAKRPELQRLLRNVQAGKVDLIAFTKLDRWFRNVAEYHKVQEILEKYNVGWQTIHEDYETSTASGRFKVNIMLAAAEDEADRTSERIKAVFSNKREKNQPLGGLAPYGYRWENKKLVVVEEEAEVVRWMFSQYITLRSARALHFALMEQRGISRSANGLKVILRNTKYIGQSDGREGICPPIVDAETFALAQEISQQREQRNSAFQSRPRRTYLFSGLVFCAECGGRLTSHTVSNTYTYYRCTAAERKLCSHTHRTNESTLEKWLLENVVSCADAYNLELETKRAAAQSGIDENMVKRKMEKLKDLYLNDLIERDTYERDYSALREMLRSAQQSRRNIPEPIDISHLKSLLEIYPTLSRQAQKEFWTRTISKIIITNQNDFSIALFYPYIQKPSLPSAGR